MMRLLAKLVFRINNWSYGEKPDYLEKKQVVIGFPHTSNMDGIRAVALFILYGIKIHVVIKQELFAWPLGPLLRKIGGVPVDRKKNSNLVEQVKQRFDEADEFTIAIAPEATRNQEDGARKPIKTGFWYIAKAADVPVILMLSDNPRKAAKLIGKFTPSDSLLDDLELIRKCFSEYGVDVVIPEP